MAYHSIFSACLYHASDPLYHIIFVVFLSPRNFEFFFLSAQDGNISRRHAYIVAGACFTTCLNCASDLLYHLLFTKILNDWNLRIFKKIFTSMHCRVTFIERHGRGTINTHLTLCLYCASDRLYRIIFMVFLKILKINFYEIFTHDCKQFFLIFLENIVHREFLFLNIFQSTEIMQSIETAHIAKLLPQREKSQ